jgi:hypothetical protein
MKRILAISIILLAGAISFAQDVAVVYNSLLPVTSAAGAVIKIKYNSTTFLDIAAMDSAAIVTAVATLDTGAFHEVYLLVDTATVFTEYSIQDDMYDTLLTKLYASETDDIDPDTDLEYPASTASKTKCEVVWDDLYPLYEEPLIIQFLGFNEFSEKRNTAKYANTDSTLVDTTGSLTADQYNGDWIYIWFGQGIGQYREIYDQSTTAFYVTPDWDTQPTSSSKYIIKEGNEDEELFFDCYSMFYVMTYLGDLSDSQVIKKWRKLIDNEKNINDGNVNGAPFQDLDYLRNTVLAGGKEMWDFIIKSITYWDL